MQASKQLVETMRLIAKVFECEADEDLIERTRVYFENPLIVVHADSQHLVDQASKQIEEALKTLDRAEDRTEWYDYLAASYAELFLGVSEEPIAPFESVYLGEAKVLYEETYFEVQSIMRDSNFKIPRGFSEPEDHLALEWSLLAHLLEGASNAREEEDDVKASSFDSLATCFIGKHLSLWNDDACDDLIAKDDSNGFYSAFANLAKAVMVELKA